MSKTLSEKRAKCEESLTEFQRRRIVWNSQEAREDVKCEKKRDGVPKDKVCLRECKV